MPKKYKNINRSNIKTVISPAKLKFPLLKLYISKISKLFADPLDDSKMVLPLTIFKNAYNLLRNTGLPMSILAFKTNGKILNQNFLLPMDINFNKAVTLVFLLSEHACKEFFCNLTACSTFFPKSKRAGRTVLFSKIQCLHT